ncbi:MAG: DUF1565 domain-containing protein, partial [Pseudonocardia sp.]
MKRVLPGVVVAAVVVVLAVAAAIWWLPGAFGPTPTAHLYVAPTGNDAGDGSEAAPLRTIQAALDRVTPGTQINLAPGEYHEKLQTKVGGTPEAPIWIKGPESGKDRSGRYQATLQ